MTQDEKSAAVDRLQTHLSMIPPGAIENTTELGELLAECWDELRGDAGGMTADKLHGRVEDVQWKPPVLSLQIERHGGTVLGSTRADIQQWTVDVEKQLRKCRVNGHRQLYRMEPGLDVKPLAREVFEAIKNNLAGDLMTRCSNGKFRVHIGEIIPRRGCKQTVDGRRKRFWSALEKLLGPDWVRTGAILEKRE